MTRGLEVSLVRRLFVGTALLAKIRSNPALLRSSSRARKTSATGRLGLQRAANVDRSNADLLARKFIESVKIQRGDACLRIDDRLQISSL
jgi:hypothetical protein